MKKIHICILVFLMTMLIASIAVGAEKENGSSNSVLDDDFVLEIQGEATPSPTAEILDFAIGGTMPKPGETPRLNSITVEMQPHIRFKSPFSPGTVRLYNPTTSNMVMVYQLRISIDELQRQAGITGYTPEDYTALSSAEDFDPATSYITLSQTKGILPGKTAEEIALGTLPDGSSLPAGQYTGELLMVPFDHETENPAMVNAVIVMPFSVETGLIQLVVGEDQTIVLQVFNPTHNDTDVVFGLEISQKELEAVTGSPHRTEEELALQAETGSFDPAYEFISLFTSEAVKPGGFLESATIKALPDESLLPSGVYTGWLVRYNVDKTTGELVMQDVDTQVQITVP